MPVERFTVTTDHLKLLQRAYVGWDDCEFGAPAIDCKRPYGNSDVYNDMAEILDVPLQEDRDGDKAVGDGDRERLSRLHHETKIVLQIILSSGLMQTGTYEAESCKHNWRRVGA